MARDVFPNEIKRMVYDLVDFETLKSLRQASKSWSSVGAALLLLPTFSVLSYSRDIHRLLAIAASPSVSPHAANIVQKLLFQSNGWDPRILRNILCNRHELLDNYETLDFVPTRAEQESLEELDGLIAQRDLDEADGKDECLLSSALQQLSRVEAVKIVCVNPFRHPILKKVWDEYSFQAYHRSNHHQVEQLWRIFRAAKKVDINIQHVEHGQLLSCFFGDGFSLPLDIRAVFSGMKSLHLDISDLQGIFSTDEEAGPRLRELISLSTQLNSLKVGFETLDSIPSTFLPTIENGRMHTVSLNGVCIHPAEFLSFLLGHRLTLRRLRISNAQLPQGRGSWREFLDEVRHRFGPQLQNFQLSGVIKSAEEEEGFWLLRHFYNEDWTKFEDERNMRTRELEDYMLRQGPWPVLSTANRLFNN
jgi:hypothetical protein